MFLFVVVYRVDNDQRETGGRSFLFKMDDFATSSELFYYRVLVLFSVVGRGLCRLVGNGVAIYRRLDELCINQLT